MGGRHAGGSKGSKIVNSFGAATLGARQCSWRALIYLLTLLQGHYPHKLERMADWRKKLPSAAVALFSKTGKSISLQVENL